MYTISVYSFVSTSILLPASNTDLRHLLLIAFAILIYIKKRILACHACEHFFLQGLSRLMIFLG